MHQNNSFAPYPPCGVLKMNTNQLLKNYKSTFQLYNVFAYLGIATKEFNQYDLKREYESIEMQLQLNYTIEKETHWDKFIINKPY